jgi:uncharacterized protein YndB with AHSA1/START domain
MTVDDLRPLRFISRPVGLDFTDEAPVQLRFEGEIAASPAAVFDELANAEWWPAWFPGIRDAGYSTPTPHGLGSRRKVRLTSGAQFKETIIAFDPAHRYAWRVDSCNVPVFSALVEDWIVEPAAGANAGDGDATRSRVQWHFCAEPRLMFKAVQRAAPRAMQREFDRAIRQLEQRLTRRQPST